MGVAAAGRREKDVYVIDLLTTQCRGLPAHRMMLLLFLQLAVKDRATELRFEQSRFFNGEKEPGAAEVGFSLSYRVDGQLYDLVPPPPFSYPIWPASSNSYPDSTACGFVPHISSDGSPADSIVRRPGHAGVASPFVSTMTSWTWRWSPTPPSWVSGTC